jgi:hypothetical protein
MGLIEGAVSWVLAIVGAALSRLIADDVKAWTPKVTQSLTRHATSRVPQEQRARVEEEWQAELDHIPGHASKLIFAVGIFWGANRIRRDLASTVSTEKATEVTSGGTNYAYAVGVFPPITASTRTNRTAYRHAFRRRRLAAAIAAQAPHGIPQQGTPARG